MCYLITLVRTAVRSRKFRQVHTASHTGAVSYLHLGLSYCRKQGFSATLTRVYPYCPTLGLTATHAGIYPYWPTQGSTATHTRFYLYWPTQGYTVTTTRVYPHCPIQGLTATHTQEYPYRPTQGLTATHIQVYPCSGFTREPTHLSRQNSHFSNKIRFLQDFAKHFIKCYRNSWGCQSPGR